MQPSMRPLHVLRMGLPGLRLHITLASVLLFALAATPAYAGVFDDCSACHTTTAANHPLTNCTACHTYLVGFDIDHQGNDFTTRPAGECLQACHITTWPDISAYVHGTSDTLGPGYVYYPASPIGRESGITGRSYVQCTSCHSAAYPSVYSHSETLLEGQHTASIAGTQCESCHDASLITEHAKYPSDSAVKYTCATCHGSLSATVQSAIAGGKTACTACHSGFHGQTWAYPDYYTWASSPGTGGGIPLSDIGDNPQYPGAHAGYTANTAKCGLCHSVHRAKVGGTKLLNTSVATCAGCHKAGATTATDVVINWQTGGPHSSGTDASCTARSCHTNSPHGVGVSQYPIIAQKLLHANTDAVLASALADPVASGISLADLNADPASTWDKELRSLVRTGYNCNQAGCHVQTLLAVVNEDWAERRYDTYDADHGYVDKTGHLGQVGVNTVAAYNGAQRAFVPVASCVSCHDQTDAATAGRESVSTVSGYTFPHSQTPLGASNLGASRAYLWMGIAADSVSAKTGMTATTMKAYDGACLKCHRSPSSGVGITY